ncbi:hypothetical protein HDU76_004148 [Blyttiomyces sp. JEL0837]|nr:hypothetical protein HDU76_004148 [Blyttiomyces sp. JEL0837]
MLRFRPFPREEEHKVTDTPPPSSILIPTTPDDIPVRIGRFSPNLTHRIISTAISKHHADILPPLNPVQHPNKNPAYYICPQIVDRGSSNGTVLNGKLIPPNVAVLLRPDDIVMFSGAGGLSPGSKVAAGLNAHSRFNHYYIYDVDLPPRIRTALRGLNAGVATAPRTATARTARVASPPVVRERTPPLQTTNVRNLEEQVESGHVSVSGEMAQSSNRIARRPTSTTESDSGPIASRDEETVAPARVESQAMATAISEEQTNGSASRVESVVAPKPSRDQPPEVTSPGKRKEREESVMEARGSTSKTKVDSDAKRAKTVRFEAEVEQIGGPTTASNGPLPQSNERVGLGEPQVTTNAMLHPAESRPSAFVVAHDVEMEPAVSAATNKFNVGTEEVVRVQLATSNAMPPSAAVAINDVDMELEGERLASQTNREIRNERAELEVPEVACADTHIMNAEPGPSLHVNSGQPRRESTVQPLVLSTNTDSDAQRGAEGHVPQVTSHATVPTSDLPHSAAVIIKDVEMEGVPERSRPTGVSLSLTSGHDITANVHAPQPPPAIRNPPTVVVIDDDDDDVQVISTPQRPTLPRRTLSREPISLLSSPTPPPAGQQPQQDQPDYPNLVQPIMETVGQAEQVQHVQPNEHVIEEAGQSSPARIREMRVHSQTPSPYKSTTARSTAANFIDELFDMDICPDNSTLNVDAAGESSTDALPAANVIGAGTGSGSTSYAAESSAVVAEIGMEATEAATSNTKSEDRVPVVANLNPPPAPAPAVGAGFADFLGDMEQQFTCSICCELMVAPHTVSCGHNYCGMCIEDWFKTGKRTCPECRAPVSKAPTLQIGTQNAIELLIKQKRLSESELRDRNERQAKWNAHRVEVKQRAALAAAASGGGGRRSRTGQWAAHGFSNAPAPPPTSGPMDRFMSRGRSGHRGGQRLGGVPGGGSSSNNGGAFVNVASVDLTEDDVRVAPPVVNPAPPSVVQVQPAEVENDSSEDESDEGEDSMNDDNQTSYGIEYAVSGRATCRTCQNLIPIRTLRFRVNMTEIDLHYSNTYYHHAACLAPLLPRRVKRDPMSLVSGWGNLGHRDKTVIFNLMTGN